MSNLALASGEGGITEVAWTGYNAFSSGSACKSRRERVSRIKVIDPAHLTEARITGHTMVRIVRTGLFSATHADLSAAHYQGNTWLPFLLPLIRARLRSQRPALRYVTHAHACLAGQCAAWKRVSTPPALDLDTEPRGSELEAHSEER